MGHRQDSAEDFSDTTVGREDSYSPVGSDFVASSHRMREDSHDVSTVRFAEEVTAHQQQQYHHSSRGPPSGNATARTLRRRRSAIDIEILAEKARLPALPAVTPGKEPKQFTEAELDKMQRYESLDTFIPQTTMHKDHLEYRSREPRWFIWVFVLVVGVLTAAVAVLMVSLIHMLFAIRMRLLQYGLMGFSGDKIPSIYDNDGDVAESQSSVFSGQDLHLFGLPSHNHWGGFAMYFIFSLMMSGAAAAICALVPSAIGPGGPEVLAFLNGVENPVLADTKALVAKFFATICTMGSGAPLGFYGSLVQIGTMVATGLLTRSRFVRFDALRIVSCFRNPRDTRIITVIGAACGFASAFSVSIGGLMIVMEQMSSMFPVRFALYVFVGSLVSSLALQVYFSYFSYFGDRDRSGMSTAELLSEVLIQFDTRIHEITPVPMNILVFIPAIFLGVVCGYLAAAFVRLHGLALNLRRRAEARFETKAIRYLASVVMTMLYVCATFWISVAFGGDTSDGTYGCQVIPENGTIMISRKLSVVSYYGMNAMLCNPHVRNLTAGPDSPYYIVPPEVLPTVNESAHNGAYTYYAPPLMHTYSSMAFGMADSTLQFLISWRTPHVVPPGILLLFGVVYFIFAALSSGVSIEGDVILPSLVIGGCIGRLVGIGVHASWEALGMGGETWTDPGVFAFLGAGCFFGGITGITFSTCVILTEMTNDFRHTLPLMLGISIAKRIAERYSHNINTTFLEERSVPILDFDARVHKYDMFSAKNVMTEYAVTMHTVTTIEEVMRTLRGCTHHAFPIISVRDGTFKGTVQRDAVVLYLWHLFLTDNHTDMTLEQVQRVEDRLFYDNLAERAYAEAASASAKFGSGGGGGGDSPAHSPQRRSSNLQRSSSTRQRRGSQLQFQRPSYQSIGDVLSGEVDADEYPPLPPFEDFWMSDKVDLSAHMDQSAFCVLDTTSLSRTYQLFRTLGMRHLVVVNKDNRVVGMITRKDLITHHILRKITLANNDRRKQLHQQKQNARALGLVNPTSLPNSATTDSSSSSDDSDIIDEDIPLPITAETSAAVARGRITTTPPSAGQPIFSFGSAPGRGGGGGYGSTASGGVSGTGSAAKKKKKQTNWIVVDEQDEDDFDIGVVTGLGGSMHPVMLPSGAYRSGSLAALPDGSGKKILAAAAGGAPPSHVVPETITVVTHNAHEIPAAHRETTTPPNRRPSAPLGSTQQRVKVMLQEVPSDGSGSDDAGEDNEGASLIPLQKSASSGAVAPQSGSFGQAAAASITQPPPPQFVPVSKKFSGVLKLVPSLTSMNESITSPQPLVGAVRSTTTSFRGSVTGGGGGGSQSRHSSQPPKSPDQVQHPHQQLTEPCEDDGDLAGSAEAATLAGERQRRRGHRRSTSSASASSEEPAASAASAATKPSSTSPPAPTEEYGSSSSPAGRQAHSKGTSKRGSKK